MLVVLSACQTPAATRTASTVSPSPGSSVPANAASTSTGERIPDADRVRLAEAFRLGDQFGEKIWPGWSRAPFAVLLVTASREYLIRHPEPSPDFVRIGTDTLLQSDVYARPRVFAPTLLATFPAVGGVPTIVVGQAGATGRRTSNWVLTVLHEHFHQMQMSHPDYQSRIAALDLARGDESGQWMLSYPFPYDGQQVGDRFAAFASALTGVITSPASADSRAEEARVMRTRTALADALPPDAYRYFAFQMWQEGIARYTELQFAKMAATEFTAGPALRAMPDFTTYAIEATSLEHDMMSGATAALSRDRRTAFYPVGAAMGLWLDRVRPLWRTRYFNGPLSLDALVP
jgi:hypothetical protein